MYTYTHKITKWFYTDYIKLETGTLKELDEALKLIKNNN